MVKSFSVWRAMYGISPSVFDVAVRYINESFVIKGLIIVLSVS